MMEPAKVQTAKTEPPKEASPAPPPSIATAPVEIAPPPAELPSFSFGGGQAVQSSSDPVHFLFSKNDF
jgi:hypothetical protein